jgi:hypothetical protein
MQNESVSSEILSQLPIVPRSAEERQLLRAAQIEWCGAKKTSGSQREIHLFWCRRFTDGVLRIRREDAIRESDRDIRSE